MLTMEANQVTAEFLFWPATGGTQTSTEHLVQERLGCEAEWLNRSGWVNQLSLCAQDWGVFLNNVRHSRTTGHPTIGALHAAPFFQQWLLVKLG